MVCVYDLCLCEDGNHIGYPQRRLDIGADHQNSRNEVQALTLDFTMDGTFWMYDMLPWVVRKKTHAERPRDKAAWPAKPTRI